MPEETVGFADMAGCTCEPCKRKRGEGHSVESRRIHDYSSQPRGGWRPRRTLAQVRDGDTSPTFGIELETDAPVRRYTDLPDEPIVPYVPMGASEADVLERDRLIRERDAWRARNRAHRARQERRFAEAGNMRADEAVSMAAPRGLWHAKHDGSVSGPEFASQPGTLAYWRAQRGHLAGMFKALLHGGMRSHDGDRCGFHVNIGTDAFQSAQSRDLGMYADEGHLKRFATLVAMNPRWAIRMSQRTHRSAGWARFDHVDTAEKRAHWARSIAHSGYAYCDHASVLNASHAGRVEFRLPRGTLRIDRFYAKLEWAAAMVEYTRDPHNVVQPSAFMRWAAASGEYTELTRMMRERFNAARFGEVA